MANIAAKRAGTGYAANDDDLAVQPESLDRIGMTGEGFVDLTTQVTMRLEKVLAMYAS